MTKEKLKPKKEKESLIVMKAIKDCEWSVEIEGNTDDWKWSAYAPLLLLTGCNNFKSDDLYKSKNLAKRHWEKFAKINGIKKWKYTYC